MWLDYYLLWFNLVLLPKGIIHRTMAKEPPSLSQEIGIQEVFFGSIVPTSLVHPIFRQKCIEAR